MRILALDPSKTSTGWALWAPGDKVASGIWELGSSLTTRGVVFARLQTRIDELNELGPIEAVFFEDLVNIIPDTPIRTSKESILLAAGLTAHIESYGEVKGFRVIRAVHQATWRAHFLGKMPRATKSAQLKRYAMERCRQLGFHPTKHDQAEAIGILDYACVSLGLPAPWSANEVLRPALGFSE